MRDNKKNTTYDLSSPYKNVWEFLDVKINEPDLDSEVGAAVATTGNNDDITGTGREPLDQFSDENSLNSSEFEDQLFVVNIWYMNTCTCTQTSKLDNFLS